MAKPLLVVRNGVPLTLPTGSHRSPSYRRRRAAVEYAASFAQAIHQLEAGVDDPILAADFLPRADWARQFLTVTARHLASSEAGNRRLAERAVAAMVALLTGIRARRGRHRAALQTPQERTMIRSVHGYWSVLIVSLVDRGAVAGLVSTWATARGWWSASHRKALTAMLRRRRLRRCDVVQQVVAWELGQPVRRVRQALRRPPAVSMVFQ